MATQELPGLDEDPINYVDDVPKNIENEKRALLARMASEGIRAGGQNRQERRNDRRFERGRRRSTYERGLAVGAPEALRDELDAERAKLLGGFERARTTQRRGHSREMDRIAAANIAYLEQVAAASVLNKQRMDQMIEAMKLAAAGGGGGGGGGGGWGGGGGDTPFTGLVPPGTAANTGPDYAAAAAGVDRLLGAALDAIQPNTVPGTDWVIGAPPGSGRQPTPPHAGILADGRFTVGPWGFDVPTPPSTVQIGPWGIDTSNWRPQTSTSAGTASPSQWTPPPTSEAIPGLGAAIAAALAAAGGS